jgi:hypothetical protein
MFPDCAQHRSISREVEVEKVDFLLSSHEPVRANEAQNVPRGPECRRGSAGERSQAHAREQNPGRELFVPDLAGRTAGGFKSVTAGASMADGKSAQMR